LTEDDWVEQVTSTNQEGQTVVTTLRQDGRITEVNNTTTNQQTTYAYHYPAKTYTVTTGSAIQTIAYGADQKPLTEDDYVVDVTRSEERRVGKERRLQG